MPRRRRPIRILKHKAVRAIPAWKLKKLKKMFRDEDKKLAEAGLVDWVKQLEKEDRL